MQKLIEKSIEVRSGVTVAYWRRSGTEEVLFMQGEAAKFPKCFAFNSSTLCFITAEGRVFVTPQSGEAMKTLREANFIEARFHIPFSNGDVPKQEEERWQQLCKEARETYAQGLIRHYARWCDEHGIGELDEAILQQCMVMPENGFIVKHPVFLYERWEMPVRLEISDLEFCKLGHWNENNGVILFVYRDGKTYLGRARKIRQALTDAQFLRSDELHVPLSSGEQLKDGALAARWAVICKK